MPTPEKALWRRVIETALRDLELDDNDTFHIFKLPNRIVRKKAILFFTDEEGMFHWIAPKLGLKPQAVVDELRERGLLNVIRNRVEDEYWYVSIQVVGTENVGGYVGEEAD